MWGSYAGALIGLIISFIAYVSSVYEHGFYNGFDKAVIEICNRQDLATGGWNENMFQLFINYSGIFALCIFLGFLIGWAIHSLIRRLK
jgi:cell division protein FtsX